MNLKDAMQIIESYGIWGIVGIVLIFILISVVKSRWFGDKVAKLTTNLISKFMRSETNSIKIVEVSDSDIINHDLFSLIDFWLYTKVSILEFSTDFRTLVFRRYLKIYLKSFKKNIEVFVKSENFKDMDDAKLLTSVQSLIIQIISDYETECHNSGIPKIVIDKMRSKNDSNLNFTIDLVKNACSSQFYSSENNMLKVHSILNIFVSSLENTVNSSKEVCESINGALSGLTFEGSKEP
jgi:hypothetical protein